MKVGALRIALLASLASGFVCPALSQTASISPQSTPKWGAHLDLEGKVGNERQLGEGDLFVPLLQNDRTMLFGNIKARMDDDASSEGNFGVGVRHMLDAGINLGAYGFFDRRRTEHANYFNQVTLGLEALSTDWDLRGNVYLPEGRRSHNVDSLNTATLEGTTVVFRGGEERSLTGFDGEIGYRVPVFKADDDKQWRVFAGAYRFYGDSVNAVQGPRVRTELTFDEIEWLWEGSRLTWGGEFQDDIRGKTGFVTARLRIPLQIFGEGRKVASLTPLERRMTDPIVRDIDVVARAGAFGAPETATSTASGGTLAVVSSATSNGAALQTALTNAGANSTVILTGAFNTTAATTLQSGQTLMGNGSLQVRSPSGRIATLTAATGATVTGTDIAGTNPTIEMATNSTVMGLTLRDTDSTGNNSIAARVNGVSGARIINSTLSATGTAGGSIQALLISGAGASNITVSGNTVTSQVTGGGSTNALNFTNGASGTISNNTLTATGVNTVTALSLGNLNTTVVTVSGNTISASGGTTNQAVNYGGTTDINAGSTGNVLSAGVCNGAANSGSISFTNGTSC